MDSRVTRLAPSPTGALHLGNARTFLANWLLARQNGWQVLLRIEDLDGPRVKAGAAASALADLAWLGLDWDRQAPDQSTRTAAYQAALDLLAGKGLAYACICTRSDVARAASAPHREDAGAVYPGTCRGRYASAQAAQAATGRAACWRFATDGQAIAFDDQLAGPQRFRMEEIGGDFVIVKSDGQAAYQLAVVVDDAAGGVTDVVRGDDLLDSTPRQILLRRALGLGDGVHYWHLPLVVGPDGRRLAKRHGDTRLAHYRDGGLGPERMLGLLGYWLGALDRRRPAPLAELLETFRPDRIPPRPITFSPDDEAYLTAQP